MTKSEFIAEIVEKCEGQTKRTVNEILQTMSEISIRELKKAGSIIIPGLVKLRAVKKPATVARQGVNPFTKLPMQISAKPAATKVKCNAVKIVKDSVLNK